MKFKNELPQYIAEFIGTFFLVFFGCGAIILAELGNSHLNAFIPIIFGGTVTVMIYTVGHISGAHFNPAVTLAFLGAGRFPAYKVPGYIFAQVLGAMIASLAHSFIWGSQHSFGVTTLHISLGAGFFVETLLSFALMFVIISVATDSRAVGELAGVAIGLIVTLCAFVGGPLTSASINPARTLGPAFISQNFSSLWLYILAPLIGAYSGAKVYEWIQCNKIPHDDQASGCC
ncbi:MAG: aquaporin [Bdellovibrionales bacterium]|nr:aquaporin [Bdellovibrionales bacterium]